MKTLNPKIYTVSIVKTNSKINAKFIKGIKTIYSFK